MPRCISRRAKRSGSPASRCPSTAGAARRAPAPWADAMHPRVCVSGVASWDQTLTEDLALYRDLGVHTFGLALRKLHDGTDLDAVAGSEVAVGNVIGVGPLTLDDPSSWPPQQQRIRDAVAIGHRFGDVPVVLTSGPAGG